MSQVLADIKYTKSHEWAQLLSNGVIEIGITDHAQHALGEVVFVEVPIVGREIVAAEACAVIESTKAASDVYSPIGGTVVAVNDTLGAAPELINQDCYLQGWLFRVQPISDAEFDSLLNAQDYIEFLASQGG